MSLGFRGVTDVPKHGKRADQLAADAWQKLIAAVPELDVVPDVKEIFLAAVRTAYFTAARTTLDDARAYVDAMIESRRIREAGWPQQPN